MYKGWVDVLEGFTKGETTPNDRSLSYSYHQFWYCLYIRLKKDKDRDTEGTGLINY